MPWITPTDIETVYGAAVTEGFIAHVQALAESCIGTQETVSDQLKAAFVDVVYRKHLAATENPSGMSSEMLGAYQYQQPNSPGLGLTKNDCRLLKKAVGRMGLWVLPTTRGQLETPPVHEVEVEW